MSLNNDFLLTIQSEIVKLCYELGDFMKQARKEFTADKIEYKGRNNLVSYVDKEAENRIVKKCNELTPNANFVNEESGNTETDSDFTWIIDPLDGTTNFIHAIPLYSISIALQHQKETIFGCVYHVNMNEMFTAIKGKGAFLNGEAITVSPTPLLANALLATGFPYTNFDWADSFLAVMKLFLEQSQGLRRTGSAAIDLVYVACGRFEGFWENKLSPWDIAAGALIVQEAGGKVTDFKGKENYLYGRELIASNSLIHEEMRGVINQYF